jgi:hypothetical protein
MVTHVTWEVRASKLGACSLGNERTHLKTATSVSVLAKTLVLLWVLKRHSSFKNCDISNNGNVGGFFSLILQIVQCDIFTYHHVLLSIVDVLNKDSWHSFVVLVICETNIPVTFALNANDVSWPITGL